MNKNVKRFRLWIVSLVAPKVEIKHSKGHLGGPQSARLTARLEIADEMQNRMGSDLYCKRCRLPYGLVMFHQTDMGNGRGCLFICEDCYQELLYPHHRLLYYVEAAKERGLKESPSQFMSALEKEHSAWISQFDHAFKDSTKSNEENSEIISSLVSRGGGKSGRVDDAAEALRKQIEKRPSGPLTWLETKCFRVIENNGKPLIYVYRLRSDKQHLYYTVNSEKFNESGIESMVNFLEFDLRKLNVTREEFFDIVEKERIKRSGIYVTVKPAIITSKDEEK